MVRVHRVFVRTYYHHFTRQSLIHYRYFSRALNTYPCSLKLYTYETFHAPSYFAIAPASLLEVDNQVAGADSVAVKEEDEDSGYISEASTVGMPNSEDQSGVLVSRSVADGRGARPRA